jgi:hypothetical protein
MNLYVHAGGFAKFKRPAQVDHHSIELTAAPPSAITRSRSSAAAGDWRPMLELGHGRKRSRVRRVEVAACFGNVGT